MYAAMIRAQTQTITITRYIKIARSSVPEIQSLTTRIQELQKSFDFWNAGYVWLVAFTIILAAMLLFTQFMSIRRGKEIANTQTKLLKAKDEQLSGELKDKDLKIVEAKESAAKAEKEAANARLETERIKESVAWRMIPPKSALELEKVLAAKPGSVNLRYMDGDPEALFLAIQISEILSKAHWNVAPGAIKPANAIVFGIGLPDVASVDAQTLRVAFSAANMPFSTNALPKPGVGFSISTIEGAPILMIGSKKPALP
jgi:hypothetical protein